MPCACCAARALGARAHGGAWCAAWTTALCPALLTLVMLALRADGLSPISLPAALAPLWLVLGAVALVISAAACLACAKFAWDRDATEFGFLCTATLLLALACGPPAASLILAVARAGGAAQPTWHGALAPLYAWLALLAVMASCACCAITQHRIIGPYMRWRQLATDPFADEFGLPAGVALAGEEERAAPPV